jgi:hypothetical protein
VSQVFTFQYYVPSPRFDGNPWTEVRIEEADARTGPWTLIDTIAISPVDADPENPATRSFTTENASADEDLWYRLIFADATGDTLLATFPIQNTRIPSPYATVEELAQLLRVDADDRRAALQRVLVAAAGEIDAEIGRTTDLDGFGLALVGEVNLERAVEHWRQSQSPFGLIGLVGETTPAFASSDSWNRHAHKLAVLKQSWGVA